MVLHWRPVGPLPASTYWQRRALLAAAAVLVLALLSTLLSGGDDAPDRLAAVPGATSAPTGSVLPAPPSAPSASSPAPTSGSLPICPPGALKVEALVDAPSAPVGGRPRLSLRVTNTGRSVCTRDLGQAAIELLVFSGSDRIWSSDDCAPGGPSDVTALQPGEAATRRATWDGRRSLPGCKGPKAEAQAGTYRVQGRVGQLRVEGAAFRLTG
jgi:hypothetical protein